MPQLTTKGIHHITSIVGDAQKNVDFYAGVLGLRLVKRTVNFDDPGTYHLYFGDERGSPGTVITFFPWPSEFKGRFGPGQVETTVFAAPSGSLPFWEERLRKLGVDAAKRKRFGEAYLSFTDPAGLKLELFERTGGKRSDWTPGTINGDVAIQGLSGAVLRSSAPQETAAVLERLFGLNPIGQEGDSLRFMTEAPEGLGDCIELKLTPGGCTGFNAVGTVHHIAWRAEDTEQQKRWQQAVRDQLLLPTRIMERNYFQSIYFREPGGILFEIATDAPGFAIDEEPDRLGERLMLPSWLEPQREELEERLPQLTLKPMEENIE